MADFKKLNEQLDTHFTLAEKYGIDVILAMNTRNTNQTNATPFEWVDDKMHDTLQKWKDSDTFYGYMPYDEPSFALSLSADNPSMLQRAYENVTDYILDEYIYFKHNYPGKAFEVVMLRDANPGETMGYQKAGLETYEQYLDYFDERVTQYIPYEERICSMDSYAYSFNASNMYIRLCWIASLEDNAYRAEKLNGEKWTYTMNHVDMENTGCVLYQYYTAMAYGYTNFITYCYRSAWGTNACSIDALGNKNDNYYYYKAAHQEVKSFENVYMQFVDDWKGVMVSSGTQSTTAVDEKPWANANSLLSSYDRVKSFTSTEDALMGIMKDGNGNEGFMLASQALPQNNTTNDVSVTFKNATKALVYTNGEAQKVVTLNNGKLDLTLKAGGGAFVIPF